MKKKFQITDNVIPFSIVRALSKDIKSKREAYEFAKIMAIIFLISVSGGLLYSIFTGHLKIIN